MGNDDAVGMCFRKNSLLRNKMQGPVWYSSC